MPDNDFKSIEQAVVRNADFAEQIARQFGDTTANVDKLFAQVGESARGATKTLDALLANIEKKLQTVEEQIEPTSSYQALLESARDRMFRQEYQNVPPTPD